jgi:hypothetical protein
VSIDWSAWTRSLSETSLPRAVGEIAAMGEDLDAALAAGALSADVRDALRDLMVRVVGADAGHPRARVVVGELLGRLGDPRLHRPDEAAYWSGLTLGSGDSFQLARFPVTNDEYAAWVAAGGYDDRAAWSDAGWAWKEGCADPWPVLAERGEPRSYFVANQPVVGVTWYEADAYARAHGARLPRWYERVWAVRGPEKRPYPWGDPFGEGNANTKEEVLERPCAVGLFVRDVTPEGIHDLAGNVGEWTCEEAGPEYLLHPGSWDQPSLASWAKALTTEPPTARWAALGFRLAKD